MDLHHIIYDGRVYTPHTYSLEKDFERVVVEHAQHIFGSHAFYIDVKRRIGSDRVVTIPDGYVIDVTFADKPRLYIVENELAVHDAFRHIGQQLLKFAVSYRASGREIKQFLLDHALGSTDGQAFLEMAVTRTGHRNVDAFLEHIIFEEQPAAVVIIDRITPDLQNVLNQLSMGTDVIEFCSYRSGDSLIHRYTPFQQDIFESAVSSPGRSLDEEASSYDTIVVPAQADGFERVFLGRHAWWAIRMSTAMIPRIKHVAAYQVAPVSAITHIAKVDRIEKYKDTGKYILYFEDAAEPIGPIPLPKKNSRSFVPQAPRYTTRERVLKAKSLADVFG